MCEPERVLDLYPLGNFLACLDCRLEFDLTRGANRVFSKAVWDSSHYSDTIDLSVRQQQNPQHHVALDADTSRFTRVARLGPREYLGFDVNFLWTEACDVRWIEQVCERAVAGAAIVLISFGSDWLAWRC